MGGEGVARDARMAKRHSVRPGSGLMIIGRRRKELRTCGRRSGLGRVGQVRQVGRVCIASSEKSKIFLNDYKAAATQATRGTMVS